MQHDQPSRRQLFVGLLGGLCASFGLTRGSAKADESKVIALEAGPVEKVTGSIYDCLERRVSYEYSDGDWHITETGEETK